MTRDVPFPWQRALAEQWLARRAQWPHALLLHGPAGYGKRELAIFLARARLCEQADAAGFPCGSCAACEWAAAREHPDLRWIEPGGDEEAAEGATRSEFIRIEQVRDLQDFVMLSSHRQGAKVIVLCPAEAMNAAAANALLKTLEEPPPGTFLLLVAHQPARLPATVLSRCTRLAAPRPGAAEARQWLETQGVADAEGVLAQAGGAPLRALALAETAVQQERQFFMSQLAGPARLSPVALGGRIDALPKPQRRERLGQWLDLLATWTFDLAAVAGGGEARFHPDFSAQAQALAVTLAPLPLIRYHRRVLRQKRLLSHPLAPRLVAEQMLQSYREAVSTRKP